MINIDSKVLQLKKNIQKDTIFISKALNYPIKIELIFRASEHQFRARAFHQCCNNINDTLILIRTEFGRTIGGYTHYKWNNERKNSSEYVDDPAKRTFLFQLDLHQIFKPISGESLIACKHYRGPIFGKGDLQIVDEFLK